MDVSHNTLNFILIMRNSIRIKQIYFNPKRYPCSYTSPCLHSFHQIRHHCRYPKVRRSRNCSPNLGLANSCLLDHQPHHCSSPGEISLYSSPEEKK